MLDAFYDRMIETYYHPENYLILLVHGSYDIPMKTSDGMEMDDASDYIYNFVLCCLCPVTLSKAGLCYNAETNSIEDRIREICRNRDFYSRHFRTEIQTFTVCFIIPKTQMNSARISQSSC